MFGRFPIEAGMRRKYRNLALLVLLIFCVASTVIHFTVGSLIAMLFPNRIAAAPDQTITIITLSRSVREQPKSLTPAPSPQRIVMRRMAHVAMRKHHEITRLDSAQLASVIAPAHRRSIPARGGPQRQSAPRASLAELSLPTGSIPAVAQTRYTSTGAGGDTSGEDPSYPGRQIPNGPVWADNGPPGQSGTAGGIVLGGGGGSGRGSGISIHDSCSPSRGDFF
jgi:hypothetical protein